MKRKLLSVLLCLALLLTLVPMGAAADEGRNYLAIGDSISTGHGLAAPETEGFTYLVAQELGYGLTNAAEDGSTAEDVLALLNTGSLDDAIANAQLITITCGGNDLMHALYEAVALQHNQTHGTALTAQDVIDAFAGNHPTLTKELLLPSAMSIVTTFVTSQVFIDALAAYEANMNGENGIMAYIRTLNPDARVILTTQYNPYKAFAGAFQLVTRGIEAGVAKLNAVIADNAERSGYVVADVYGAFTAASENLCNATMRPLELDFHPNAAGHGVIADTIIAGIRENCVHVDVDGTCTVCGVAILPAFSVTVTYTEGGVAGAMVETASQGDVVDLAAVPDEGCNFVRWEVVSGDVVIDDPNGMFTTFTMPANAVELKAIFLREGETEAVYGDTNNDGKINSKDAALILQYYAGIEITAEFNAVNADVNGDGKHNSKDAALILQYYAGIIAEFPVVSQ